MLSASQDCHRTTLLVIDCIADCVEDRSEHHGLWVKGPSGTRMECIEISGLVSTTDPFPHAGLESIGVDEVQVESSRERRLGNHGSYRLPEQ